MESSTACADQVAGWHKPTRALAGLEEERHRRVQTVLQIRARCENANAAPQVGNAILIQQLLSAAVKDLEDVDNRLYELRSSRSRPQPHRIHGA